MRRPKVTVKFERLLGFTLVVSADGCLTWVPPFDVVTVSHRYGRYLFVLVVGVENKEMVRAEVAAGGPTFRTHAMTSN